MVDVYPAVQISGLAIAANRDSALGINEILALPADAFIQLPAGSMDISDPSWGRSLWLRITLTAHEAVPHQTPSLVTILEIQKPYLDQLNLYRPPLSASGAWQVQRAGDFLPKEAWSLPGQFPRFLLPSQSELLAMPGGQMAVYLHVPHRIPASFNVKVWSAIKLMENIQIDYLLLGITLGALLFAVMVSIGLLIYHRDRLFIWYALYALSVLLASLSHAGLAFQYVWPWGGLWPSNAAIVFMLLAATSQLQFCKLLFMSSSQSVWPVRWCETLGVINTGVALIFPWIGLEYWTSIIIAAQALIVVSMITSCTVIFATWRLGNKLALALAITYIPLFLTVLFSMLEAQGFLGIPEMSYNAPIYAAAFEVTLLGLFLQWFGHERHGKIEHDRALASTDPLTGFASASSFRKHLHNAWQSPPHPAHDTAVVYISLRNENQSGQRLEHLLQRCVRVLRSATNSQDVVARLDGRLLALLLPDTGMGEQLSQRLSRIIALGLMPDSSDPKGDLLQFRIAYTTRLHYRHDLAQLHQQLRELLEEKTRWGSKPIRVIDHRSSGKSMPREVIDSEQLENIWNRAVAQDVRDSQQIGSSRNTVSAERSVIGQNASTLPSKP